MDALYIIQHIDDNEEVVDSMRVFKDYDKAMEALKDLLVHDNELLNYSLTKHVYDEECGEYIIDEEYDLGTLVNIEEFIDSGSETESISVIDSSEENDSE